MFNSSSVWFILYLPYLSTHTVDTRFQKFRAYPLAVVNHAHFHLTLGTKIKNVPSWPLSSRPCHVMDVYLE